MKIGLYTIHASHNVGAMLQAFALIQKLQSFGAHVELINMYSIEEEERNHHKSKCSLFHRILRGLYFRLYPQVKIMESNFDAFYSAFPLSKRYYSYEQYIDNPAEYDIHLVGSDQVWNLQKGFDFSRFYFLDYLPKNSIKISYASSFGTTLDTKDIDKASLALSSFSNISVREDTAVDFVKKISNKDCEHVLDPTLLLSSLEWDNYISKDPIVNKPYIFFYGVNKDDLTWDIIKMAKKQLNLPVIGYPGPLRPQYKFDKFILDGGPLQFINLIKNASLVITSSFHGLAFSLNYGKKVILLKYGSRMERMESLIRVLQANEFVASSIDDAYRIVSSDISYDVIQQNLYDARNKSLEWIKNIIFNKYGN